MTISEDMQIEIEVDSDDVIFRLEGEVTFQQVYEAWPNHYEKDDFINEILGEHCKSNGAKFFEKKS
jgi:hypothetical protein